MAKQEDIKIEEESQGEKRCTKCGEVKPLKEFHKAKSHKDGFLYHCKRCVNEYDRKYYATHTEKHRENQKKYRVTHKESRKRYRDNNKDKARVYYKRYLQTEKGKRASKRVSKKRYSKLEVVLSYRISGGINQALKGKKNWQHWEDLVGYTIDDLIKRLKKALPKGVTWEVFTKNRSKYHIDHIIPQACFNYETANDMDFKKCWALSNLQILPARENVRKHDKIAKPFQPSLLLRFT